MRVMLSSHSASFDSASAMRSQFSEVFAVAKDFLADDADGQDRQADWLARVPEKGVGLLVTQFQASPPSAPGTAPAGSASSTHTTLLVLVEEVGGGKTTGGDDLPARSQVARPP